MSDFVLFHPCQIFIKSILTFYWQIVLLPKIYFCKTRVQDQKAIKYFSNPLQQSGV